MNGTGPGQAQLMIRAGDRMGQMTSQTSFAGVPTAWTYNNLSQILTEAVGTGSLAQTTTNTWDTLGDELTTQNADGTTSMAYDLANRMTSLTDPDHNQTVWTRDNLGRVISEQNPSGMGSGTDSSFGS